MICQLALLQYFFVWLDLTKNQVSWLSPHETFQRYLLTVVLLLKQLASLRAKYKVSTSCFNIFPPNLACCASENVTYYPVRRSSLHYRLACGRYYQLHFSRVHSP